MRSPPRTAVDACLVGMIVGDNDFHSLTPAPTSGLPSAQKSSAFCALQISFSPRFPAWIQIRSAQKSGAFFRREIFFLGDNVVQHIRRLCLRSRDLASRE
jgi:hypothetical protein